MKDFKRFGDDSEMDTRTSKEFKLPPRGLNESFYANLAFVSGSLEDIRLDFGRRGDAEGENPHGDVTIYMSPQLGKELLVMLIHVLGEYEKMHGPIPCRFNVLAKFEPKGEQDESNLLPVVKLDGCQ